MHLGTNFWFTGSWTGEVAFAPSTNFTTTTNPWNPVFLEEIEIYSTLRFMDWMTTNWSGLSRWDQRTLKTDGNQTGATNGGSNRQSDGRQTYGIAYEWLIDLCNRNLSDMWICVPHLTVSRADQNALVNDYSIKLAILIKHGVDMKAVNVLSMGDISDKTTEELIAAGGVKTCDPLNPALKVYVEYSNETWNGMFSQCDYCIDEGVALALAGNQWYQGWGFQTFGAVRAWEAFGRVYGTESDRFVRVIAGQVGWGGGDVCKTQVAAPDVAKVNPKGLKADCWAGAPYMGGESVSALRSSIANCVTMVNNNRQWLTGKGIKYVSYEGGQHAIQAADAVSSDPAIHDCYMEYLEAMANVTDGVFAHYAHCGAWGPGGAWGSKRFTGQPLSDAHKCRALVDWVAENPRPVVTGTVTPLQQSALTIAGQGAAVNLVLPFAAPGARAPVFGLDGSVMRGSAVATPALMLAK